VSALREPATLVRDGDVVTLSYTNSLVTFYHAFGTELDAQPHRRDSTIPREGSAVNECDMGIHRIEVRVETYGDDRFGAFVEVSGIDEREVVETWRRVVRSGAWQRWWPN
jgi:hypothetical protein